MTILIDFKIYAGTEKNSETIGRMFIVCNLKNTKTAIMVVPKIITYADKNIMMAEKERLFLLIAPCCYKKIFKIIPRFQKQTP